MRAPLPLLAFAALAGPGCEQVTVQAGLDERSANEIALVLDEGGIASRKEPEAAAAGGGRTWAVTVVPADSGRAFQLLSDRGLPRAAPPGFDEILRNQSLIPTSGEERARHVHALSGELARTFESVRGILEARVHLALPEPVLLEVEGAPPQAVRASVLLKVSEADPPIPVDDARRLVAGAVPGLEAQAVTVVVVRQPAPPRPVADGLVTVAGVRVAPSSVGTIRSLLGAAVGLDVLLAAGLVMMAVRRWRDLRQRKEPA
ncbi:MAG: secretion protein [Deltaproteobacteria bacterium]|nr:secretion protein [Deltaproteobacteria bacterium]